MTDTHPGDEVIVEDVLEDLGTFDPHSEDGDDDESVFEDDTDPGELPDPDTEIESEDPRDG